MATAPTTPLTPFTLPHASSDVSVRPWGAKDWRAAYRWPQPTLPAHWLHGESAGAGPRLRFAICLGDELIGRITLYDFVGLDARLGIYLHPAYTDRGHGSEALRLFARFAFGRLGLTGLVLDVAEDNKRAIRCYQRVGFRTIAACESAERGAFREMMLRPAPAKWVYSDGQI